MFLSTPDMSIQWSVLSTDGILPGTHFESAGLPRNPRYPLALTNKIHRKDGSVHVVSVRLQVHDGWQGAGFLSNFPSLASSFVDQHGNNVKARPAGTRRCCMCTTCHMNEHTQTSPITEYTVTSLFYRMYRTFTHEGFFDFFTFSVLEVFSVSESVYIEIFPIFLTTW